MGRKAIVLFCALTLAASWAIQIAVLSTVGMKSDLTAPVLVGVMWSPTLIAGLFLVFHKPAREGLLWRFGKLGYWPVGVVVAALTGFACVGVFLDQGWATSDWFAFSASGVDVSGGPWLLGEGAQGWPLFVANAALTAFAFAGVSLVATAGEEFAWRGFLQGHMVRNFGIGRGVMLLGTFWSFWHLPLLLMGYNHPENPILGAFVLSPIELVATSFFYAWLTIRSGSFWPAALAHAGLNSIQEGLVSHLDLDVAEISTSLFVTGVTVVIGLLCWAALARRRAQPSEAADLGPA